MVYIEPWRIPTKAELAGDNYWKHLFFTRDPTFGNAHALGKNNDMLERDANHTWDMPNELALLGVFGFVVMVVLSQ